MQDTDNTVAVPAIDLLEIRDNFRPEDVFTDDQLKAWARRKHTALEIFDAKDVKNEIDEAGDESKYY